jgi:hypothetical protein
MKLLVDECLSEELTKLAHRRGHPEASHVRWIGKGGAKDWDLMPVILDGDWTFVTRNAVDFRGPAGAPGQGGEYARIDLHAGLICLTGPVGMNLDMQLELFEVALDDLDANSDLVNQVLEVVLEDGDDAEIRVRRYDLPPAS